MKLSLLPLFVIACAPVATAPATAPTGTAATVTPSATTQPTNPAYEGVRVQIAQATSLQATDAAKAAALFLEARTQLIEAWSKRCTELGKPSHGREFIASLTKADGLEPEAQMLLWQTYHGRTKALAETKPEMLHEEVPLMSQCPSALGGACDANEAKLGPARQVRGTFDDTETLKDVGGAARFVFVEDLERAVQKRLPNIDKPQVVRAAISSVTDKGFSIVMRKAQQVFKSCDEWKPLEIKAGDRTVNASMRHCSKGVVVSEESTVDVLVAPGVNSPKLKNGDLVSFRFLYGDVSKVGTRLQLKDARIVSVRLPPDAPKTVEELKASAGLDAPRPVLVYVNAVDLRPYAL